MSACVYNDVFDYSVNWNRGQYLLDVIRASRDEPFIWVQIMDALASIEDLGDGVMLAVLARMFAQEGDQEARAALLASVERDPEGHPALGELIELDGLDGFMFVAERLGDRGFPESGHSESEVLLSDAIDRFSADAVWQALDEGSRTSSQVALFAGLARERHERWSSNSKPNRPKFDEIEFDQLRRMLNDDVEHKTRSRVFPWSWGRVASDEDLLLAAKELVAIPADDVDRMLMYLRIFQSRSFPMSPEPILRLASNNHERVRVQAINALANVTHDDVRQLGLQLMTSDDPWMRGRSLDLLNANHQPGDHVLMESMFERETDEDALHWIGMSILRAAEQTQSRDLAGALLQVYERGPCAMCRRSVARRLIELDALQEWIANECLFDADLGTREVAREYLERTNLTPPLPGLGEGAGG